MSKYKIKVNVEFAECDESVDSAPIQHDNGSFSMAISGQDAISIDKCESSVLQTAYPAIREAVSRHLSEMSKKKPVKTGVRETK